MRRHGPGGLLVVSGLLLVTVALGTLGAVRLARDTEAVRGSAAAMLEVPAVRERISTELSRQIVAVYAPQAVPTDVADRAASRMLENGAFVDEFERALGEAHGRWLDGETPLLTMDPQVLTAAALSGMRDADLVLAGTFPTPRLVEVEPVELPLTVTAGGLDTAAAAAIVTLIVGLALTGFGYRLDPHLPRALGRLSAVLGLATVVVVVATVAAAVPATPGLDVPVPLGVLAAVSSTKTVGSAILAGILLVAALLTRAASTRVGPALARRSRRRAAKADTTPVTEGVTASRKNAGRHRAEAIDAFFAEGEAPAPSSPPPDEAELAEMGFSLAPVGSEDASDDEPDESADAPTDEPDDELTPDQRRAAAAADDRRAALERIDGTKSRLRTHLPR